MAELLVSVHSVQEAKAALTGGASLIDVKDPARGSLGRPQDATITAVVRLIGGRTPVSAAMGELADHDPCFPGPGVTYLKWGLSGCRRRLSWPEELTAAMAPAYA